MTIITLHHVFCGHCMNSSVFVLNLSILKMLRLKTNTSKSIQCPQNKWCKVIVINNRYFDIYTNILDDFLENLSKTVHFVNSLTHPYCENSISRDTMLSARRE